MSGRNGSPPPSVAELARAVRARDVAGDAAIAASLDVADRPEVRALGALVARHSSARAAVRAARQSVTQRRGRASDTEGGALAGVPVVVADDIADAALPTTAGSRCLTAYTSPFEATAVARLHDAGAVVIGKGNVDEFGIGTTGAHSAYGPTRHPAAPGRVAGGASGGAAAAVAAGIVRVALGVDASGGVRLPAAWCGVVGLKPTHGRVSRSGVVACAPSLEQIGVFARTVDDAATALEVIAGRDPRDPTSADFAPGSLRPDARPVDDGRPLRDVRIGRPRHAVGPEADPRVLALLDVAAARLRDAGAAVETVAVRRLEHATATHRVIRAAEAYGSLARVRAPHLRRRGAMGEAASRTMLLGAWLLADGRREALHCKALEMRAAIAHGLAEALDDVELLLTPTAASLAPPASAPRADEQSGADDHPYLVAANLAGLPALTVPVGRVDGLPVGAHLIGRHFGEALLFRAGAALERVLAFEASP